MKLFLIRHGHTEIVNGEAKLSKEGISQSKYLAEKLRKIKFDKIYASDLERSKNTAREYSNDFIEDKRIREIYRVLIGGPEKEGTLSNRKAEDKSRADKFFQEILKENGNILIFGHGNIIKYFLNKVLMSKKNLWKNLVLDNCSISIIEKKENSLIIKGINIKGDFEEYLKDSQNIYSE